MSVKNFIKKLWISISKIFNSLDCEIKKNLPIAISIVEALKTFIDSPVNDVVCLIVEKAIPGEIDDVLIEKTKNILRDVLPKVLLNMSLINEIESTTDPAIKEKKLNGYLQKAISDLKFSTDEQKQIFYHGLASIIVEKLSDGKLTWSEGTAIAEYIYKNSK